LEPTINKKVTPSSAKACNPEQWVELHGDYLYRFALGRLRNSELAENLVQETFLAALQSYQRFMGKSTERTWLVGILKHKMMDHFRRKYREISVTDLEADENAAINEFFDQTEHLKKQPANWQPLPRQLLENGEFWTALEQCLGKLSTSCAQAFSLREIDGLASKEVCKVLGIASTNLWVLLHRARLQLRQCLEIHWFER